MAIPLHVCLPAFLPVYRGFYRWSYGIRGASHSSNIAELLPTNDVLIYISTDKEQAWLLLHTVYTGCCQTSLNSTRVMRECTSSLHLFMVSSFRDLPAGLSFISFLSAGHHFLTSYWQSWMHLSGNLYIKEIATL
jgi:hypothetical protein